MIKLLALMTTFALASGTANEMNETKNKAEAQIVAPPAEKHTVIEKPAEPAPAFSLNEEEKKLLARLVHAEAEGEPYEGKVAVAEVVLNRMEDERFPDTIKEVIYEKNAFQPVQNGAINEPASEEAHQAVEEAIQEEEDHLDEVVFFYNPETATSEWIYSRQIVKTIGNHAFAI